MWDYWHVPDQYTYIRTFAEEFFPSDLYGRFRDHLLAWGRVTPGCTKILSPWLSYYIDGFRQELPADIPHGPWAYVFSFTNWDERTFTGGETFLLAQDTSTFGGATTLANVRADFVCGANRAAFQPTYSLRSADSPRRPSVEGTREPLDSRIAVHGWFYEPAVIVSTAIEEAQQRRVSRLRSPSFFFRWATWRASTDS